MSPLQTTGGKDDPNIAFILNSIIKIKLTFWPLASAAIKCRKRPEKKRNRINMQFVKNICNYRTCITVPQTYPKHYARIYLS